MEQEQQEYGQQPTFTQLWASVPGTVQGALQALHYPLQAEEQTQPTPPVPCLSLAEGFLKEALPRHCLAQAPADRLNTETLTWDLGGERNRPCCCGCFPGKQAHADGGPLLKQGLVPSYHPLGTRGHLAAAMK